LWLTQLVGRPIDIIPWFLKNNHSPWGIRVTYSRSCPLWSLFPVSKSNLHLMTILKLDIGIYYIGTKVSKCNLVNFLESLSCGNNSFWSKPTVWMISDTLLAIAPSFVYTWISNEVTHCVNSSVTWWPQNFNHVNFFESPRSTVRPIMVSKAIPLHG
jgi:hypothetical protein